ncbi:MAG: PAS domain S-box protein, partial [Nitrososphaera sp.]|nr:PAS domain S-box protein [Nitrososphaera sp.]
MAELPELHSLLKRQLKRYAGAFDAESTGIRGFIEDVSRAYAQFDDDRTMLERSLELSSQELLQANSEMRAIFQALPDLYFVLNEEGTILDCKGGSAADFLMPPNRLIGRHIQDVSQGDVRDVFVRALQLVQVTGQVIDFEYSIPNGSLHYYEARLVPLPGTNIMAIIRNITGRKRAEADLEQSLSMLQATLESTADGILVVDNDGKIQSFNKKFVEMWRIPESVLAEKDDDKALACVLEQLKDPDAFLQKVKELYAQPDAESYDMIEFKDGRIIERYSKPQTINDKSVGRVWSFHDTSDRRKLEEQLRHSQKMESIGTLAGGIAHDFNNILGIILGYASTLEGKIAEMPEVAHCRDAIVKASERGASLVRQMLTFARKTDVRFEPVNVNAVVRE